MKKIAWLFVSFPLFTFVACSDYLEPEDETTELVEIKIKADFLTFYDINELDNEWAEIVQDQLPEQAQFEKIEKYENPKTKNTTLIVYYQSNDRMETDMYTMFADPSQEEGVGLKIECKTDGLLTETNCTEVHLPEKGRIICDCESDDSYMNIKTVPEMDFDDYPWNKFPKG